MWGWGVQVSVGWGVGECRGGGVNVGGVWGGGGFCGMFPEMVVMKSRSLESAFAERNKKQIMIDLRGISSNWFKNQLCPSIRFSWLGALS